MSEDYPERVKCADCGREIVGEPIVISATERLCQDCWPFLLKPLVRDVPKAGIGVPVRSG